MFVIFKDNIKSAQKAIKNIQPVITANSLVFPKLSNTISSLVDKVIERLPLQGDTATTITYESIAEQHTQQQIIIMDNLAQQIQQMRAQMNVLASTVYTLQTKLATENTPNAGRGGCGAGRCHGRMGLSGYRLSQKYCHTHGKCAHGSTKCYFTANGHNIYTTYSDMQGGSNTCFHWILY